jgi:threonine dehydrogenase-like Zn-dependent dehydrogenase/predicted dehydrogenase
MLSVLEDLRTGEVSSYEIPAPELRAGGALVKTAFSAISAGTERAKIEQGSKSLLGKALARPDLVRQVLDFARSEGIKAAYQRVQNRLDTLSQLGYSCAGTILEVADDVQGLRPGDRVACAGGGYANHSEINFVPQNLLAKIPDNVPFEAAALTTIGAIAMQGLRQSGVVFGETVAVIGAGLMGVLTVQMAKAAGCRVIAIDLDAKRVEKAKGFGADIGILSTDSAAATAIQEFTGYGADTVIITAATPSTDPIELAARITRDRGKIVIVGDVGLGVSREHVYHKELSIVMSRSYGPGRYDYQYEEEGIDYPVGYVRWTERRNMEAFLDLLSRRAIDVSALIDRRYPAEKGADAYSALKTTGAYTCLIQYPHSSPRPVSEAVAAVQTVRRPALGEDVKVGCIGAGSFARNVIFPALRAAKQVQMHSVASASGVAAQSAKQSFKFFQTQTPAELIRDPNNQIVFVLSQHDSHARYVASALAQGKGVFVEKPLAASRDGLAEVVAAYDAAKNDGREPFVMAGFNRRFAPLTEKLREFFVGRREPMSVYCRVNAGFIPSEHWVHQHGGRIVGEMCHFIDWARSVVGSPIMTVYATAIPDDSRYHGDNLSVNLSFADGSIASVLYLANGDKTVPKEFYEVFCAGSVAGLDDFRELRLSRGGKTEKIMSNHDKGHKREIALTTEAFREGQGSPIPFTELVEVTEATFAALNSVRLGQPVRLGATEKATSQELVTGAVDSQN